MRRFTLHTGHVLDVLRTIPEATVQCVVTSPPYWSLRDYKTPPALWGGDAACEHAWGEERTVAGGSSNLNADFNARWGNAPGERRQEKAKPETISQGSWCARCGGWRGNLGLEPTPDLYVEHLVMVFREIRRVLRDDGTVWLNLGDCYSGSGKGGNPDTGKQSTNKGSQTIGVLYGKTGETAKEAALTNVSRRFTTAGGIPPKNLIGIPWRVAFALQVDGWYLRQENIWHKTACMPESVEDRTTRAHEQVFLFSKGERYFYDRHAVSEASAPSSARRYEYGFVEGDKDRHLVESGQQRQRPTGQREASASRNLRSVWTLGPEPAAWDYCLGCATFYDAARRNTIPYRITCNACEKAYTRLEHGACGATDEWGEKIYVCSVCSAEDQWVDHYAVMPTALAEICIKAGAPPPCASSRSLQRFRHHGACRSVPRAPVPRHRPVSRVCEARGGAHRGC